jgi:beta-glucosidase
VWTVMSAYNKVNGVHCAENRAAAHRHSEKGIRLQGVCVSDWGSTYSTAPTVNAGMDLEMPGGSAHAGVAGQPASFRPQATAPAGSQRTRCWPK